MRMISYVLFCCFFLGCGHEKRLGSVNRKPLEFKKCPLEIYVYPRSTPSYPEVTKKNIKKLALYYLKVSTTNLPNEKTLYGFYAKIDSCKYLRKGHLDDRIRYLIILHTQNGNKRNIYINNREEFEIDNQNRIYRVDSVFNGINELIPKRYRSF